MTVTLSKASLLLDSASRAVEQAHVRFRKRAAAGNRFLGALGDEELAALVESSSWLNAAANDVVVRQGAPGDHVLFITEGNAREEVSDAGTGAFRAVLGFLGPGDEVGLLSLLDGAPHPSSVIAMKRLRALQVPSEVMERHLQAHPDWHRAMAEVAVSRFRASSLWLQALL